MRYTITVIYSNGSTIPYDTDEYYLEDFGIVLKFEEWTQCIPYTSIKEFYIRRNK